MINVRKDILTTITAGTRIENSNIFLTIEAEKGSRKKVKASHPESMTYITLNNIRCPLIRRKLRRNPKANSISHVPNTPKFIMNEKNEFNAPPGEKIT